MSRQVLDLAYATLKLATSLSKSFDCHRSIHHILPFGAPQHYSDYSWLRAVDCCNLLEPTHTIDLQASYTLCRVVTCCGTSE